MEPELAALLPIFVEETRDRLERLAACIPRLDGDAAAMAEAKRELHTIKGAGRMLQIGVVAALCHAAEAVLEAGRPERTGLLTRVVDRLNGMVDEVARGGEPAADEELLALVEAGGQPLEEVAERPSGKAASRPGRKIADRPGGRAAERSIGETAGRPARASKPAAPAAAAPAAAVPAPVSGAPAAARPAPARPAATHAAEFRVDAGALDAVAERATQMRIMALASLGVVAHIDDLARLAESGMREPQPAQVLAVLSSMLRRLAVDVEASQRRLSRATEEQVETMLALQLQPLRGFLQSLGRHARELARSLAREVEVEIEGEETRLDRRIVRELDDALLHLVRNAVDHGIEPPDVRRARGKPRAGRLRLAAAASGSRVRLVISDDGAGIDPERVLAHAVASGRVEAGAAGLMSRADVLRLLFIPGFSTRREVSEISGRGLGLDVVATAVGRVGGEVSLDATPGAGTVITVDVPVARRGEEVLLVRVGELRLALPAAAVRAAGRIDAASVIERDGRYFAQAGDRLVPFLPLAQVYGQATAEVQLLLEGQVAGRPLAVAVDEVESQQEVLVRPLPRSVPADRLLEGVALLASGEPVGVLSPAALAEREHLRTLPTARRTAPPRRVRVLLVDDSLVTREMERRLLDDAGFDVQAVGGAEAALTCLAEQSFDCVVTDIEMPGMDGFELTTELRATDRFSHLPIVVVSTRDRAEDRLRGLQAGADAYLTKQSLDAGELIDILRRLSGR